MADVTETYLRDQLLARRQRLESAIGAGRETTSLLQLLNEVDSALDRMKAGTYGLCETCHDPVEKERLMADPLVRYCLDHLTSDQQRALEQDLTMAGQLQRELLPKQNLHFGGWEAAYHYQPLGPVSGDYCDIVLQENASKDLFFALGDASGKGVAAALLMTQLHAILRTLIVTGLPIAALVERASRIFCEGTMPTFFATLVCGRAEMDGKIEVCNAGHCPALLVQGGRVTRFEATGLPLGMFCDGQYTPQRARLDPGDTLFLYTDGVSEARSPSDEEFGEKRLMQLLARRHTLAPQELIRCCWEDLAAFRAGVPLADDVTMLAIRRAA
jgi:sigma-B regulation protein RsbU (phosphoserine phosphatase)